MRSGSRGLSTSIAIVLVLLMVGLFAAGSFEPQDHESEDRIGTWHTVTTFEADVGRGTIERIGHVPGDGSTEITISRVGDGIFVGSLDGHPIQGGLRDNILEFSYHYPSIGYNVIFDGVFLEEDLLYGTITGFRWGEGGYISTILLSRSPSLVSTDPPEFPELSSAKGLGGSLHTDGTTAPIDPVDITFSDYAGGLLFGYADMGSGIGTPLYMAYLGYDADGCLFGRATYHDGERRFVSDFTMSCGRLTFTSFNDRVGDLTVSSSSFEVDYQKGREHDIPATGGTYRAHVSMADSSGIVGKDDRSLSIIDIIFGGDVTVLEDGDGDRWILILSPDDDGCVVTAVISSDEMKPSVLRGTMDRHGNISLVGSSAGEWGLSVTITTEG